MSIMYKAGKMSVEQRQAAAMAECRAAAQDVRQVKTDRLTRAGNSSGRGPLAALASAKAAAATRKGY